MPSRTRFKYVGNAFFVEMIVSVQIFTEVSSPTVNGSAAALQCFHFWFYLDGFLDGAKNESLAIARVIIAEE